MADHKIDQPEQSEATTEHGGGAEVAVDVYTVYIGDRANLYCKKLFRHSKVQTIYSLWSLTP